MCPLAQVQSIWSPQFYALWTQVKKMDEKKIFFTDIISCLENYLPERLWKVYDFLLRADQSERGSNKLNEWSSWYFFTILLCFRSHMLIVCVAYYICTWLSHFVPLFSFIELGHSLNGNIGTIWVNAFVPSTYTNAAKYWEALKKIGALAQNELMFLFPVLIQMLQNTGKHWINKNLVIEWIKFWMDNWNLFIIFNLIVTLSFITTLVSLLQRHIPN